MRQFFLLFPILACLLIASCGKDDEEVIPADPGPVSYLQITSELEPKSKTLHWTEMTSEERRQYPREGYVVNSRSDFPKDAVFGLEDIKSADIDFNQYSLLINYMLVPGYVQAHQLMWLHNNVRNRYEFISMFTATDPLVEEDPFDVFTYYRAAVLVPKIAEGDKVAFLVSY